MIINHETPEYLRRWITAGYNRYNGAFYYSQEITANIIPNVVTDRNWITINQKGMGLDHSIVFIHNNLHPEHYDWLNRYEDLILVCGVPETVTKVEHLGHAIYLPLSVDVDYVRSFAVEKKTREAAFAGRNAKQNYGPLPLNVDRLTKMKREQLLPEMAKYKAIYAVGRTAIEAKILGCEVKAYDRRFLDTSIWKVLDNKDAAKILQEKINEIDGATHG